MDAIKTFPAFTIFFSCLMILEILGLTVIPSFHMVTKAMIMAGVIGFYILVEKKQNNIFLLGLIFALLGDCFLLYNSADFFMIGLGSFLLMQIAYAFSFNGKRRIVRQKDFIFPIVLSLFGILILAFLWEGLGELKIAVSIYSIAIIAMAIFAYLRHPLLRGYSFVMIGVILFIISDGLLAYNKFGSELPYAQIAVMVTYMIAQYCIVTGEVLGGMPRKKIAEKVDSAFARHSI